MDEVFMAGTAARRQGFGEMHKVDMEFGIDVDIMPDYDRTACLVLFQLLPNAFYADQPDRPAPDRPDHTFSPGRDAAQQHGAVPGVHDQGDGIPHKPANGCLERHFRHVIRALQGQNLPSTMS